MTICPSCGFRNEESETFCRNPACGAFQGWGEERVRAEQRSTVEGAGAGEGSNASGASIDENTQPFDTASEARRADPPAEPRTRAGQLDASARRPWPERPLRADRQWRPSAAPSGLAPPARVTGEPPDPGQGDHARPPEVVAPPATAVEPPAEPPPATAVEPSAAAEDRFPAAEAEPGAPADPATGTLAPGAAWHSEWQRLGTPRREPPAGDDSRGGDWDRSASYPPQSGGQEPMPQPGGAGPAGAGRGHGRRVLSAAETAWGTPDFVHRPDPPPAPGELPPREDEAPSFATAWFETGGRTRGTTWPATGAAEPVPFPSEEQLLKRPPLWERLLRRTPIPVPGEGSLRRAPSARDRERQRAIRRFGALVLVVVLVGGGLWLASSRSKPASVAPAGQPSVTSAPPALTSVRPGRVVASTQSGSRLAANVLDGKTSTFWSRLAPSDDNEPFLRFFFDGPVRLARVTIASGASGSEFSRRPRPRKIELRFSDNSTIQTTLADRTGFQTVSFSPRQVSVVRLVILSTYPSAGPQRTSVREVRFFAAKR